MGVKIGFRMAVAWDYVAGHPGCTKLEVARVVGPHGSLRHGYEIVNRAIDRGLIRVEGSSHRWELYAVEYVVPYPPELTGGG